MELIRVSPDKEKARNILKVVMLIEKRIKIQDKNKMAGLVVVDYYEIIKELVTAMLLLDGYKTLSHKDLINYLCWKYKEIDNSELFVLDQLRTLRNRIAYDGFFIEPSYLSRNENGFRDLIGKLKSMIDKKLK